MDQTAAKVATNRVPKCLSKKGVGYGDIAPIFLSAELLQEWQGNWIDLERHALNGGNTPGVFLDGAVRESSLDHLNSLGVVGLDKGRFDLIVVFSAPAGQGAGSDR